LNHRSVAGVKAGDLTALRTAVDRVSVDDVRMAIEWIAARQPDRPFDRSRVATLGRGFGGYLAVRALQLQPELFRCGVAIDAPMDLHPWLRAQQTSGAPPAANAAPDIPVALIDHESADWQKLSVLDQAESLTNPVFFLVEPGRRPAIDVSTDQLRDRLRDMGRTPGHLQLDPGFAAGRPASRATVYRKIDEFLKLQLHPHEVKIGQATEAP
jgi:acetyl esterase/lipase